MSQQLHRPRVLLADDSQSVCNAVTRLLSPYCEMVGSASDSDALFDATMQLRPDVVLLDFSLPGGLNGIELCRCLTKMAPDVSVVAFTAHDDPEIRRLAHEAGAAAFVWKLQPPSDLLRTIQAVTNRSTPSDES